MKQKLVFEETKKMRGPIVASSPVQVWPFVCHTSGTEKPSQDEEWGLSRTNFLSEKGKLPESDILLGVATW